MLNRPDREHGSVGARLRSRSTPEAALDATAAGAPARGAVPAIRVAYIMSRFPKLTETFVLYEMLAVERLGLDVQIYPLQREPTDVMHPEAEEMVARAHFTPLLSWSILGAQLHYLTRRPSAYFATLWTLVHANFGSARYLLGALAFFPKAVYFARRMTTTGVDHVHAHFASHPAAVAFVIHRLAGIPYSFTAHGSDLHRDRHMLAEKIADARFVATVSEFNRRLIESECGMAAADKVCVIHCGVDTGLFQPRTTPRRADRRTGLRVCCIGTLHEVKGQRYLIEACGMLAARGVDFTCELVGDGPDRGALATLVAEADLQGRVRFLGRLRRVDVVALLDRVDVLVAPSVPTRNGRREGIPVALMEAAACGIPVVGTRITGVPELVEDGEVGFLVDPGDSAALAEVLERIAADADLRRRLGARARVKARREFDLETNAGLLVDRILAGPVRLRS